MPFITRSQSRSGQPPDRVASSRANTPGTDSSITSDISQKSSREGGVDPVTRTCGGCPTLSAAGNESPGIAHPRTCRSDCMSCPSLLRIYDIKSYNTGRKYTTIGIDPNRYSCKLQNYIYLLTCQSCGVQYVGESIIPINRRMNIHRTSKTGCTLFIEHYSTVCSGATFSIQILEKLPGNGYRDGAIDEEMRTKRLEREDYWMKTLRTIYPYGLNDKVKSNRKRNSDNDNTPVGKHFMSLPRHGVRYINTRSRQKRVSDISNLNQLEEFILSCTPTTRGNDFRKLLEGFKLKHLRSLAGEAHIRLELNHNIQFERWYRVLVDTILTKV